LDSKKTYENCMITIDLILLCDSHNAVVVAACSCMYVRITLESGPGDYIIFWINKLLLAAAATPSDIRERIKSPTHVCNIS